MTVRKAGVEKKISARERARLTLTGTLLAWPELPPVPAAAADSAFEAARSLLLACRQAGVDLQLWQAALEVRFMMARCKGAPTEESA